MKKKLLIATVAAAVGTALAIYLVNRRKTNNISPKPMASKKSHHITDVFSHAKSHSKLAFKDS